MDELIDYDLSCNGCGYGLRGLPVRHVCPECGTPYNESSDLLQAGVPDSPELSKRREAVSAVARSLGVPADAILFVLDACAWAAEEAGTDLTSVTGIPRHVGATDVCRAVRDYGSIYFDDDFGEAAECLAAWDIRSSEDVGKILFGLVESGRLTASASDRPDDFKGLFTLGDLFVRPHPSLDADPHPR